MFTGIISDIGTITKAHQTGDLRLEITCDIAPESIKLGDSIACNGTCLTVVEVLNDGFAVELSAETVACTAANQWQIGKKLNLERSLKVGDTLDGHLVSGHVDGIVTIQQINKSGDSHILTLVAPAELSQFIAQKGSVTLDGISLTVNNVENTSFCVNIIPHTWQNTTLCKRKIGEQLNLEIDIIARYVSRLMRK
ncbi:MAG: riboflavin synthase [Rickettsiales bacterium]|jgi:riboflavin synthase